MGGGAQEAAGASKSNKILKSKIKRPNEGDFVFLYCLK